MEYFSEIYGNYYRAVAAVLAQAAVRPLTEHEISEIVSRTAFGESAFCITPALVSGRWPLLHEKDGLFSPITKNDISMPMTRLQREWLAAIMEDARCSAFFSEAERQEIKDALDCCPLYDQRNLKNIDACADGDSFANFGYRQRLQLILSAIRTKSLVRIGYTGAKGSRIVGDYLPCRLEYSPKDDKLRLHAVRIRYGKVIFTAVLNLGRVETAEPSAERYRGDINEIDYDTVKKASPQNEPAVVELTDQRNTLERFMVQFASYDKRTRRIDDSDKYLCSIYYDPADETELLIRLLSFGITVRVLSPQHLVDQVRQRIERQLELMNGAADDQKTQKTDH